MRPADVAGSRIAPPATPEYEAACQVFNLSAPARPTLALTARTVGDVQDGIRAAVALGLPVRVHSTGHAAAGVRPVGRSLLIRTRISGSVEIDADRRIARIPAGTRWGAVVAAAAVHGLAVPHGSSPTVGAVGYLLRGGLSFYGRKVGLAANSLTAIELVTADGELRRVDHTNDEPLFWALRGGGGGFGVVTAVEVELFEERDVVTGAMYWPISVADQVQSAWQQWTLDAPWEATTALRILRLPPVPSVPAVLAEGPVVCIDGAVGGRVGDPGSAESLAQPLLRSLRAVAKPILDTWQTTTTKAVLDAHMDPTDPVAFVGDHMLLSELGPEGAAAFLGAVGEDSGSPFVVAGLRQLGGALGVKDESGGVLSHIDARFSFAGSGVPMSSEAEAALRQGCATVRSALAPWDTGRTVPSFVEDFRAPQGHLSSKDIEAVDEIRAAVDPAGLFRDDIAPNASKLF